MMDKCAYELIYICKTLPLLYSLGLKAAGVSTAVSVRKSSALGSTVYSAAFNKLIQFVPQTLITQTYVTSAIIKLNYSQIILALIEAPHYNSTKFVTLRNWASFMLSAEVDNLKFI